MGSDLWAGVAMRETIAENAGERLGVAGKIRTSYWLAITLIAALAVGSFWIMERHIAHRFSDTNLVSLAGEQKMLSQRVALLTNVAGNSERRYIHAAAINELRELIAVFEKNHVLISTEIDKGAGLDPATRAELSGLLTSPPYDVDFFARKLVEDTREFIDMSSHQATQNTAEPISKAGATAALSGYALISDILADTARQSVQTFDAVYRLLFAAMMIVLAASVIFIFQPMIRRVEQRTRELMTARNEMAYLAAHDRLTGLRNRVFLTDHFEHMIENARRRNERVGVLHLDLDDFKGINDTYGHMAGDHVLRTIANRIKEVVRAADIAARLGGDEFVILLNSPGAAADMSGVANRIIESVNRPIEYERVVFRVGASIGISIFPEDSEKPNDLLVDADLALYRAKAEGRGCVRFFSSDLRQEHEFRRMLEADLRQSLAREEIMVDYQPQVSLTNGKVTGIEALARWNRKGESLVPPDVFIPVAEKAGLLDAIGRSVMTAAIRQGAAWQVAGIDYGRISINVSWSELVKDDFVQFILAETQRHGLSNSKLAIEIVEGTILHDDKADIAGKLGQLRTAGVFVELDDFGTGYASLTRVSSNEIDRLKIDERFIRDIDRDDNNRKIVRALVDLAHGLGISVVAEGAETEAEIETLRALGCGNVQGYGIAYPMEARLLTDWLMIMGSGEKRPDFLQFAKPA
jgi:diguanylate cyclase (GGDEF)-like protein